ncbi:MAG TPA: c-type cytochrome [Bryobacteraceae bacterium]|jgi:cytochrome c oxidase cbb3-type subunit 3|nr:c-type cytochrome [Bryobacteraceae bacterium]
MCSRCRDGIAGIAILLAASFGCRREQRNLRPEPTGQAMFTPLKVSNPSSGIAYEISEGQRLYTWYNCSGCHANGGGGIGPPLIKTSWIYGGEPAKLFESVAKGRPNGMPAWGDRIPEYQIWQIVAYVRSLNQQEPSSATPKRLDTIETNPQTIRAARARTGK